MLPKVCPSRNAGARPIGVLGRENTPGIAEIAPKQVARQFIGRGNRLGIAEIAPKERS
jgi:hypothetical protein